MYLQKISIVQKIPATNKLIIATAATEGDGIKLKKRDGTEQCIPPVKYADSSYKLLFAKQKEWLWQDCKKTKAIGDNVLVTKK